MRKLTLIFTLQLFTVFQFAYGKAVVYSTYQDYMSQKGIEYDDFVNHENYQVIFKKGSVETGYKYGDIWGFTTNDELWRCTPHTFVKLITGLDGPLYYYEYGFYHAALHFKRDHYTQSILVCFVSNSLEAEIYPIYHKGGMGKKFKKFIEDNPQFESFANCFWNNKSNYKHRWEEVRPCVEAYYLTLE